MAPTSPAIEPADLELDWSDELPPLGELVALIGSIQEHESADDETDASESAELEELVLSLAIEFEVRESQDGLPRVTGSTPTQWTETTVLPVFHRLKLRLTRSENA
jgi:hypothetical protein